MASTKIETKVVVSTTTDSVELGKEVEKLIVSFNSTKAALKALEAQKLEVEGQIRELLGDAETGTINGVERVRILKRNRSGIDRETLQVSFPEAYTACLTETAYTVLQAK
jgi:predicted phage-related endonuclease